MKILFKNLPEGEGTVKVSLDGGNTFTDHPINTIREENGISLADDQDYSKILIKGNTNIFRNLEVISRVKVDGTEIPYTYEKPVYGVGIVTYKCYAWDGDNDGQITEDDISNNSHIWVKNVNDENIFYIKSGGVRGLVESVNDLILLSDFAPPDLKLELTDDYLLSNHGESKGIRYRGGDLINEEETVVGTETVTETIEFLQDPPTITENGTVIADEGKAFKSVNVEVPKSELGFKCFYNYAPSHYFGDESESTDTQDSDFREYNILMSNEYLEHLCNDYLGFTYNGVVGIYNHEETQDVVNNYYTLDSEYNLFEYHTIVNRDVLHLYFYRSTTSQDNPEIVDVRLIDGSRIEYEPM